MFTTRTLLGFLLLIVGIVACRKVSTPPAPSPIPQGVVDIDGNVYDTLTIGGLTWFTKNLRVTRFRNGDPIQMDTGGDYWNTIVPQCAVLDHLMANKAVYGLLYNYTAASDPRGLCPQGWHTSTDDDWKQLELHLGMDTAEVHLYSPISGPRGIAANVAGKLKAMQLWPTLDSSITNASGMSVLPARAKLHHDFGFEPAAIAAFWTPGNHDWYRRLTDDGAGILRRTPVLSSDTPGAGYSCRCVKDP